MKVKRNEISVHSWSQSLKRKCKIEVQPFVIRLRNKKKNHNNNNNNKKKESLVNIIGYSWLAPAQLTPTDWLSKGDINNNLMILKLDSRICAVTCLGNTDRINLIVKRDYDLTGKKQGKKLALSGKNRWPKWIWRPQVKTFYRVAFDTKFKFYEELVCIRGSHNQLIWFDFRLAVEFHTFFF